MTNHPAGIGSVHPGPNAAIAMATCDGCGKPLTGKQSRFCSQACNTRTWEVAHPYARAQKALDFAPPVGQEFKGETYEPKKDQARLSKQLERVFTVMADCKWHTLSEIARLTQSPEASVSARLRDLRRPIHKKGLGLRIDRQRVSGGLFQYRWVRDER